MEITKSKIIKWKNKISKWLPHIIGILFFLLLPLFVFKQDNRIVTYWIYSYYNQLAFMIIAFYVNYLVLVPRFFYLKKRVYFFISLVLFAVLVLALSQVLYHFLSMDVIKEKSFPEFVKHKPRVLFNLHPKLIDNFFLLLLVLGFSTGMAVVERLKYDEYAQKEIEKARLDNELAFLKKQISPHFFFNSLNNIYALIAIDKDKAQIAVEKLSGLMRYLIYDSDVKTVELQKEFDFTQNYIDLMQQRLTSKVKLNIEIQKVVPVVKVPPLIFITFIENAFKHGVSYQEQSFINIFLRTENNHVVFSCVNSIPQIIRTDLNKKGGVGIVNVKKRLDLIYGDKAKLNMENKGTKYLVDLTVPINLES